LAVDNKPSTEETTTRSWSDHCSIISRNNDFFRTSICPSPLVPGGQFHTGNALSQRRISSPTTLRWLLRYRFN
jgi:hypothetical protein